MVNPKVELVGIVSPTTNLDKSVMTLDASHASKILSIPLKKVESYGAHFKPRESLHLLIKRSELPNAKNLDIVFKGKKGYFSV